jgi:phosphodiesterase/alkaline phosphatase D-like protein
VIICANRRAIAAVIFSLLAGSTATAQLVNGVAAGDTTQTSSVLWARSLTPGALNFQVSTDPTFASGVTTVSGTVGADTLVPVRAGVSGLTPGTQYYYRATDAGGATMTGSFRTVPASGHNGFHMGVSGDWRGDVAPFPFANNVAAANLDLWVELGDTIYADVPSPNLPFNQAMTLTQFRQRHAEIYTPRGGLNTLADVRRSTTTLSVIDDHEVTDDFAGYGLVSNDPRFTYGGAQPGDRINTTPLFNNGVQAFHEYHPIEQRTYAPIGDARTDGRTDMYRSVRYGADAQVIVADARSFRDQEVPGVTSLDPAQVGAFLAAAADPSRTMLGNRQFQRLTSDLLAAQQSGVTWKFVNIGEPTQNLGVIGGPDRYEGYAAERAALLGFIHDNNIQNVVFVTADIHGTVVNNLTYATSPGGGGPQVQSGAWEISTGAGAYDAPFGPTVASIALLAGVPGAIPIDDYLALPNPQQETYIQSIINVQLAQLGYDSIGLAGSGIPAVLTQGDWTATNSYGWTDFQIDPLTQALTVTTYGVPWYPSGTDPALIAGLQPQIVQQIVVQAVPTPAATSLLSLIGLTTLRRRR